MAQLGRPRKARHKELAEDSKNAEVSAAIFVNGTTEYVRFTVPNIAGHLIQTQRKPSVVKYAILDALREKFGQNVRID